MNCLKLRSKAILKFALHVQRAKYLKAPERCSSLLSVQPVSGVPGKSAEAQEAEVHYPRTEEFPERCVQVFTCGKLFEKWRKERRHWYVHKGDVSFAIRYVDTGNKVDKPGVLPAEQPVVVALHGSPGSYESFSYMTTFMHNRGARVIAPTLPDLTVRKKREFRHSSEEKRELVKDFLTAINVPRVDMLMCHSSSLFPGLLMCLENQKPFISSLCLINPTAFDYPKSLQPVWAIDFLSRLYEFPVGEFLTTMVGKLIVSSRKNLKGGCYLDHFLSAFTLVASDIPQGAHNFQALLDRNLPVFLAFSENDKLIHKNSLYKMAHMMTNGSDISKYGKDGQMESRGGDNPTRRVLAFENGTHFLYKKYPEILSENVTEFLFQNFKSRQQ